mgnify:CR=1 FL=1
MGDVDRWEEVLDCIEESLVGYGDRLVALDQGSGRDVVPAFEPPTGLGPIPPSLLPRARRLAFWATRLDAQIRADLDAAATEIRVRSDARRRPAPAGPEPAILDRIA